MSWGGRFQARLASLGTRLWTTLRRISWVSVAVEVAIIWGVLFVYQIGRYVIQPDPMTAYQNALLLMRIEDATGLGFELSVQELATHFEPVIRFLNAYYAYMHFTPIMLFLIWLYLRNRGQYAIVRNIFLTATVLGFFVHWLLPTAPPRFVAESGMIDTLVAYHSNLHYGSGEVAPWTNQFAAVPSFHFGWALFIAVAFVLLSNYRWRWIALVHPSLVLVAIMATGNHFFLDAVVAVALEAAVAWAFVTWARRRGAAAVRQAPTPTSPE